MSLERFLDEPQKWGSSIEKEIRLRIRLCVAAYAYEIEDDSIMPDHEFDELCKQVDTSISTGNKKLDKWFKKEFDASTGQWIHKHPELRKIKQIYLDFYQNNP